MRELTIEQMQTIDGAGFWEGFLCGAGIMGSIAVTISPEPVSKLTAYGVYTGTLAACGMALS